MAQGCRVGRRDALATATTLSRKRVQREGNSRRDLIAVSSVELPSRGANVSMHPLNPLNARRARFERITEVLGFADHLPVPELHNAHRVRRLPVVGEDEFSDPEIGSAEYPPHREAFLVRLRETGCLNVMPTTDALPRLRILEHCVLLVNLMLRLEVVRVGGRPSGDPELLEYPCFPSQSSLLHEAHWTIACAVASARDGENSHS